jgi:hypothetical protein
VILCVAFVLIGIVGAALVGFGMVVRARHARAQAGRADLFLELNVPRREPALAAPGGFRAGPLRRWLGRMMLGHDYLVGDEVEVLPLAEILASLDAEGCVDGIPFQGEMIAFCGKRAQVFRCIDKIYDFGRTRRMRRLDGFVLLSGLRCNGAVHGGCQARCYLIWSTRWLRRPGGSPAQSISPPPAGAAPAKPVRAIQPSGEPLYDCQFTRLHSASRPLPGSSLGQELRPLVSGNFTLGTWLVGLTTRWFNAIQHLRRGIGFPYIPLPPEKPAPATGPHLNEGDEVLVRPVTAIANTLNRTYKNRGLWFDRDMIKHCGGRYRVLARVERIIDDATGEMRTMKTPCVLLKDCDYSGEFLHFNVQHDPFFWREAWLERLP